MELLLAAFTAYVWGYILIVPVWIAAVVLSLSRWRQHPRISLLTLTAILILFADSLVSIFANLYLPLMLHDAGWAGWEHGMSPGSYIFFGLTGLSTSVMQAVAWSLLIAAILSDVKYFSPPLRNISLRKIVYGR